MPRFYTGDLPSLLLLIFCFASVSTSAQPITSGVEALSPLPPASPTLPVAYGQCEPYCSSSVSSVPDVPGVKWNRFALVSGSLSAAYTGQFLFEKRRWWDDASARFRFNSQLNYSRNFDKMAHFYATGVQALVNARLLQWSGLTSSRAAFWGSMTSVLAQTHVEIHDGFHTKWGFDWYDQAANVLGATWFYAREHVEPLHRFTLRWTYVPSKMWQSDDNRSIMFADDYSGHTYWVSMRIWDLLPPSLQKVWPSFLQVSAGATLNEWSEETWARDYPGGPGPNPEAYVSYHLSVDLDWQALLPQDSWFFRSLSDVLNQIHLPAPAVRVHPHPKVHLVFIGQN